MNLMENSLALHSPGSPKRRAIVVGLGVACIHFTIAYFLTTSGRVGFGSKFGINALFVLTTPSLLLTTIANFFLWTFIPGVVLLIDWMAYSVPYILASSISYGVVGGLLVSGKPKLFYMGMAIIFLCLFGVIGLYFMIATAIP